ncbi:MAG: hypothetical protein DRH97_03245 [Chloroflexi bacterium]|nr:MAG: hypothetical protein DRH97_03245 [Chloroflexota bacterium]
MVDIIIKIPSDKVDDFRTGFLKVYPNESGETDLIWIKIFIRQKLIDIYKTGKTMIAREEMYIEIDEEIID